jgi:hypothetical protein
MRAQHDGGAELRRDRLDPAAADALQDRPGVQQPAGHRRLPGQVPRRARREALEPLAGQLVAAADPQVGAGLRHVQVREREPVDAAADLQRVAGRDRVQVADPERALPASVPVVAVALAPVTAR